jgi:hypothetical protein
MGNIQDARGILSDAETSLRQLMESALREQRYADVGEIAGLADGIARLLQGRIGAQQQVPQTSPVTAMANIPVTASSLVPRRSSKSPTSEYPRFERDDDKLVKIGWSKKNKATYEHRAPHEAIIAFGRHLSGNVTEGKVFAVEDLLPVPDVANGGEIPAYQVYLMLAWLQHVGAIAKKGRDGYVLRRGGLGIGTLDSFWASLPTRIA